MNAISKIESTSPKPPKSEAYAKIRSSCVDAFARLEFAIINLSGRFELKLASRALVGQRIKKLRETKSLTPLTASEQQTFLALCDRAEALLKERTDLVHAEMIVATTDNETMAIFQNSADRAEGRPESRVYSLRMLRQLASDVGQLAMEFDSIGAKGRTDTKPAINNP